MRLTDASLHAMSPNDELRWSKSSTVQIQVRRGDRVHRATEWAKLLGRVGNREDPTCCK